MEEMEEEPPTPPSPSPFWLSARTTPRNPLFNTGLHVAALSITAVVLMAVVTPSLLTQTHQFFRPNSIKKGWDSINLVLVVFAIVCGFLGRKDDNKSNEDVEGSSRSHNARLVQDYNWRSYSDEHNVVWLSSLRRASSSYPDLIRQEMMWDFEYHQRPRYYDDLYHFDQFSKPPRLVRSSFDGFTSQKLDGYDNSKEEKDFCDVEVIEVDDNVKMNKPKAPSPPPPPPPPPVTQLTPPSPTLPPSAIASERSTKGSRQEYDSVGRRIRRDGQGRRKSEARKDQSPPLSLPPLVAKSTVSAEARKTSRQEKESISGHKVKSDGQGRWKRDPREAPPTLPPPSPPPPPPPPPSEFSRSSQKKRGGTTKEIITSIYQQSKRKNKQKRRSHENLEDLLHQPSNPNPLFPPPSPQPPPLPLPPPSFFQNIFSSKKGKSGKKSLPHPPPPLPPPPRRQRPPPTKPKDFDLIIDQLGGNGSESPLIPIPPPPPPPFKVPSWKFVVQGDYVKISGSPLGDDDSGTSTPTAAGNTRSPLFFPSPDVNIKADDFIARFRNKLKLEKMSSMKHQKQGAFNFSSLGPDSSPSLA